MALLLVRMLDPPLVLEDNAVDGNAEVFWPNSAFPADKKYSPLRRLRPLAQIELLN